MVERTGKAVMGMTLAGLLPFFISCWASLAPWQASALLGLEEPASIIGFWQIALLSLLIYGAVILSFMGGARWGAAIRDWRPDKLLITILPAFVAWLAVIPDGLFGAFGLDLAARFSVLLASFVLLLISELMASGEWAPWYRTLRMRLTLVTSAFLILTILGLIR